MTEVLATTLADVVSMETGRVWAVTMSGTPAVVLGTTSDGAIEVYRGGSVITLGPDTPAVLVTEPEARQAMLAEATSGLSFLRRCALLEQDRLEGDHQERLAQIRQYAIDKHLDGVICQSGLNEFLRTFGLGEFEPRLRVSYTVRGSYDVAADDATHARTDAQNLSVDLSGIDDVDTDSATEEIAVDEVERIED